MSADLLAAVERDERRQRLLLAAMVLAVVATIAIAYMSSRGVNADELREVQNRQTDATLCMVGQLNQHRQNSYTADEHDAERHGEQLMVPAPPPPALPVKALQAACDRVMDTVED